MVERVPADQPGAMSCSMMPSEASPPSIGDASPIPDMPSSQ